MQLGASRVQPGASRVQPDASRVQPGASRVQPGASRVQLPANGTFPMGKLVIPTGTDSSVHDPVSHECHLSVTRVAHECRISVAWVSHKCHMRVPGGPANATFPVGKVMIPADTDPGVHESVPHECRMSVA